MSAEDPIRLQIQEGTRKKARTGDLFVLRLLGVGYVWGRVINANVRNQMSASQALVLIYIYNSHTTESMDIPVLKKENLAFPPCLVCQNLWSWGYLKTVKNETVATSDRYEVHCFQTRQRPPVYLNEFGEPLDRKHDPCGAWSLLLFRGINRNICDALGLSPNP